MELRPGYKKTEIGVFPADWDIKPLSSVVEGLLAGVSVNSSEDASNSAPGGKGVLKTSAIFDGRFDPSERKSIAVRDVGRARLNPKQGAVLISRMNTPDLVGECGYVEADMPDLFIPDRIWMTAYRQDVELSKRWLALLLSSKPIKTRIKGIATGTSGSMKNIAKEAMLGLLMPFPTCPEQDAIAKALSDVDASIAALSRLIAKKRDLRQGAMQRLLTGQTRLPGFAAPWQEKRLGELGTWRGGMTPSMQISHYWEGGSFPWLSSGDVKSPTLNDSGMHIREAAIASKATTVVPAGSIVFVMRSGILRKYFPVASIERSMAINQDIKALTVAADYDPTFIRQMLHWRGDDVLQSCLKTGTTVESIDFGWLKAFELRLPSTREEQSAIAQALSDVDGEITALDARLDKTRALKQAMMQALLTGRVRLPVRGDAAPQTKEAAHG